MQRVGDIRRVIDGKVYDTETAEPIHTFEPIDDTGDFHYFLETLFITKKGNFFVAGEGGAMSPYAQSLGGHSWGGASGIEPLSITDAAMWLEDNEGHKALTSDERFAALLGEA
jgi:hypothetical protein